MTGISLLQQARLLRSLVDEFELRHTRFGEVLATCVFDVSARPEERLLIGQLAERGFLRWCDGGKRFVLTDEGLNSVRSR